MPVRPRCRGPVDPDVLDRARRVFEADPRIRYALVFGSFARGSVHAHSDFDVAFEASPPLGALDFGGLAGDLEAVAGRSVDLVDLCKAPPFLAWRVFRDGRVLLDRDHAALVARRARAIMEYLDWKPFERRFLAGARRRALGG